MGFSAVALYEVQTNDAVSPGAPTITGAVQLSNKVMQVTASLPTADADGSELSGMTKMVVATLPQVNGVDPFAGMDMAAILAIPGVTVFEVGLTPADAGAQKTIEVPVLNLGGFQSIAAAVTDAA